MKLHLMAKASAVEAVPVAADQLLSGTPVSRTWVHYEEPGGTLAAGQWEATVGKWRINYTEWEYVVMISGRCTINGDDGTVINAGPGDCFVIEPGFCGTWEVLETMRKHWVIQDKPV